MADSVQGFAQKIKAKYPGTYDDIPDAELTTRILAKYPQYRDMVDFNVQAQSGPAPQTDEELATQAMANMFGNYARGIGGNLKGAYQNIKQGQYAKGAHQLVSAAGQASLPLAINAAPIGLMAAPGATIAAVGGGLGGQALAQKVAQLGGMSPDQRAFAGDIGGLVGASGSMAAVKYLLPSKAAAGALLQSVQNVAGNTPIDLTGPGNMALRAQELRQTGGTLPKVIRDFLSRATDPGKPPITYAEARDFYSNATSKSAQEMSRLSAVMQMQLGRFTHALGQSIADAAASTGQLQPYLQGMSEYANASKIARTGRAAVKALPYVAGIGGTAGYLARRMGQ